MLLKSDLYIELLNEFRQWNLMWEKFDKKPSKNKPPSEDEFIESLRYKFHIYKNPFAPLNYLSKDYPQTINVISNIEDNNVALWIEEELQISATDVTFSRKSWKKVFSLDERGFVKERWDEMEKFFTDYNKLDPKQKELHYVAHPILSVLKNLNDAVIAAAAVNP